MKVFQIEYHGGVHSTQGRKFQKENGETFFLGRANSTFEVTDNEVTPEYFFEYARLTSCNSEERDAFMNWAKS